MLRKGNMLGKVLACMVVLLLAGSVMAGDVATFDDLTLASESYWNGSDTSGGFTSGDNWFTNTYNVAWSSWDGFAYSNRTDTSSTGVAGQYTAYSGNGAGGGANGSTNYAIGYIGFVTPPQTYNGIVSGNHAQVMEGAYFTNNAYAYDSMLNGDAFAKQFGGASGDDADWFLLTIHGLDAGYARTGDSVDFYLADYRFADNSQDYIVTDWAWVDLSSLGTVSGLEFTLTSSDNGAWGMNTPAYFAMDTMVPEPATMCLLGIGGIGVLLRRRRNK